MPEGDTIHRTAARLASALEGGTVASVEVARWAGALPSSGEVVDAVSARGKHLLIDFSGGLTLHTHLGMSGSWHLYRDGQRWQRPRHLARATVGVDGWAAVCFAAPLVRLERRGDPRLLDHLGPDLTRDDVDLDAAVARLDGLGSVEIGVALLDQRVACGVGNVYKSETLFACGIDPTTRVGDLDPVTRRELLGCASRLLRANLGSGPRRTVDGGLAVYGRAGRPCRRCGTPVAVARQGTEARVTYWCPTCQPPADRGGSYDPAGPVARQAGPDHGEVSDR